MTTRKPVNICIASAGDIILECKIVREVCSGINEGILPNNYGTSFHILKWEEVFPEDISMDGILKKLTEEFDVLVFIFHKKIHILSDKHKSFPIEDFLSEYDSWKTLKKPQLIFLFKNITPLNSEIKDPQLLKIMELKKKVKNNSLFACEEFSVPYEFCEKIHDQLEKWAKDNV